MDLRCWNRVFPKDTLRYLPPTSRMGPQIQRTMQKVKTTSVVVTSNVSIYHLQRAGVFG